MLLMRIMSQPHSSKTLQEEQNDLRMGLLRVLSPIENSPPFELSVNWDYDRANAQEPMSVENNRSIIDEIWDDSTTQCSEFNDKENEPQKISDPDIIEGTENVWKGKKNPKHDKKIQNVIQLRKRAIKRGRNTKKKRKSKNKTPPDPGLGNTQNAECISQPCPDDLGNLKQLDLNRQDELSGSETDIGSQASVSMLEDYFVLKTMRKRQSQEDMQNESGGQSQRFSIPEECLLPETEKEQDNRITGKPQQKQFETVLEDIFFRPDNETDKLPQQERASPVKPVSVDWNVKFFPQAAVSDSDSDEPQRVPGKIDQAVQTDSFNTYVRTSAEVELENRTKENITFVNAIVRLKTLLNSKQDLPKDVFADILETLSQKSDGPSSPKIARMSFDSDLDSSNEDLENRSPDDIKLREKNNRRLARRRASCASKVESLLPIKTPKKERSFFGCKPKNFDFQPVISLTLPQMEAVQSQKDDRVTETVSKETVNYILRKGNVDDVWTRSTEAVLSYIEAEVEKNLLNLGTFWKNSTIECAVKVINEAALWDSSGIRLKVCKFLKTMIDSFYKTRNLSKHKNVLLECKTHFISHFCQNLPLCMSSISYAIEKITIIKNQDPAQQSADKFPINEIENSYYLLSLLEELLLKFRKDVPTARSTVSTEETEERDVSIFSLWRRNWRSEEGTKAPAETKKYDYRTHVSYWLEILEDVWIFCVDNAPLHLGILHDCIAISKDILQTWTDESFGKYRF